MTPGPRAGIKAANDPRITPLACHPETPTRAVRGIEAGARRIEDGALAIAFTLSGDLTRLRIPTPSPPRLADGLWRRTCFEVFVALKGDAAYREFNFSPSGEWAVYAFRRYREAAPPPTEQSAPKITVRRAKDALELDAVIRLYLLPALQPSARLSLALSAVVEEESGALSYWALNHPPGAPDFHHPDCFALELAG